MEFSKRVTVLFMLTILLGLSVQTGIAQDATPLNCGDIVQAETTPENPLAIYQIQATAGTRLTGRIEPLGSTLSVIGIFTDVGGNTFFWKNEGGPGLSETFTDLQIASSNPYLYAGGTNRDGYAAGNGINWHIRFATTYGAFTIYLGCELADGTVIEPGASLDTAPEPPSDIPEQTSFSGYGFPGLMSIDFSAGIEIPLTLGQPQTAPVASDVALYTYAASAGEVATLSISRVSGDISIGVTVINRDTNEIVFFGGLPSSDNLSAELTFPTGGTYAIGLFRVDTAERTGTSGAVQIQLE